MMYYANHPRILAKLEKAVARINDEWTDFRYVYVKSGLSRCQLKQFLIQQQNFGRFEHKTVVRPNGASGGLTLGFWRKAR